LTKCFSSKDVHSEDIKMRCQ